MRKYTAAIPCSTPSCRWPGSGKAEKKKQGGNQGGTRLNKNAAKKHNPEVCNEIKGQI